MTMKGYGDIIINCISIIKIFVLIPVTDSLNSLGPPRVLPEAFDLERVVPEGTVVQLPCPVEADPDTLFFEWYRDRESLGTFGEERYRIQMNGILKIKTVMPEDTGLYVCRAINGFGRVDINVTLIVLADDTNDVVVHGEHPKDIDKGRKLRSKEKPLLINVTRSNNGTLRRPLGASIRLKCVASGNPEPHLTWLRNGQPLADTILSPGSKRGRWTLYLRNLQEQDDGNYTCVAYNVYGHVNYTFIIQIIPGVRKKPELRGSHPVNTTVELGETAAFQCRVKSDDPPHVQWLKKEDPDIAKAEGLKTIKIRGEHFRVMKSTEVSERADGSFLNKLLIPEATEKDSGKYICLGANTIGYSYRSAFLTVRPAAQETYLAEFEDNEDKEALDHPAQFSSLFITIPVSLGVLVTLLVVLVVHYNRKTVLQNSHPPDINSKLATASCQANGENSLSMVGKLNFHHALQSSDGTWSQAPSTLVIDPGQPDSFSDCGSSFVFWGDPNLYPDAAYKVGCILPRPYSPNNQKQHVLCEGEYVRYLDNV